MTRRSFIKMHGLGNDFVVIDARAKPLALAAEAVRALADRNTGIGCDQVIAIEPAPNGKADAFMRIFNADGGEVAACGNGTRCVASLLMAEQGADRVAIETASGLIQARAAGPGEVAVDMGEARLSWDEIPLSREADTLHLPLGAGPFEDAVGVNMGNPHAVFFVADAEAAPLEEFGPRLETDPLFPERANIGAAHLEARDRIRLRVWERGVGLTRACGTGACAALVAAVRRELTGRSARVRLDGGDLGVTWRDDGHVVMTGPAATSFEGSFEEDWLR